MRLGELRVADLDLERARIRTKRQRTQEGEVTLPQGAQSSDDRSPSDAVSASASSALERDELVFCKTKGYRRYAHHAPDLTPGIFDRLAEGGDVPEPPVSG